MKMQHVLVPLDQSELAEAALDYAVDLVEPQGRLTLLRVVEPSSYIQRERYNPKMSARNMAGIVAVSFLAFSSTEGEQFAWENAGKYLDHIADRVQLTSILVAREIREGDPSECILDVAGELDVDAIVMSTHGRSGISRWMMGSVAQKVLCAAACPVLLVPQRAVVQVI